MSPVSRENISGQLQAGRLMRAAGTVMLAFLLSRALGLGREMIIGLQFGTSRELDAYLAAFRIPDLIFQLIAGGALGSAFIPTFTFYLARGQEREAWRMASAVLNLLILSLTLVAAVAAILAEPLVRFVVAPGFEPAAQALTANLMRPMLLASVIFGVSGLAMGVLNSYQHFLLPALAPAFYNLAIIGGALFLAPRFGIYGLVVGVVLGSLIHLLVQLPVLFRKGLTYSLVVRHPGVGEVLRLMLPRIGGLAAVQVNFLVSTILASGLVAGSVSALNYAWLLMLLPQGLIAQAVATASFPTMAAMAARQEIKNLRETLSLSLRLIWFLTIPASVGLLLLRQPLVEVLLERGRFGASSTQAVAWALAFFSLGLVAHSAVEILSRGFYALHDTKTPVLVGMGAMILNIILSLALLGPLAHGGLALANTFAASAEMILLLWILQARLPGLGSRKLAMATGKMVLATLAVGISLLFFLASGANLGAGLLTIGGIFVGGGIYLFFARLFGVEELLALLNLWRKEKG